MREQVIPVRVEVSWGQSPQRCFIVVTLKNHLQSMPALQTETFLRVDNEHNDSLRFGQKSCITLEMSNSLKEKLC